MNLHIDIVGPLPEANGHHYLLTIFDKRRICKVVQVSTHLWSKQSCQKSSPLEEKQGLFIMHWSISLCICEQVHCMGCDWLLVKWVEVIPYICQLQFSTVCRDIMAVSVIIILHLHDVLSLWGVRFGVEVLGTALGIGNGIIGVSSFLRNRRFHKVILPDPSTLTRYWWAEEGLHDLWCPIGGLLVVELQLFVPFEKSIGCALFTCIALWDERSDGIDSSSDFGLRLSNSNVAGREWVGTVRSHVASGGVAVEQSLMFWMSVFLYWRMALVAWSLSNDP